MEAKSIPNYKSWYKHIGRGVRTWTDGDNESTGPRGPMKYPVMYCEHNTPEILSAIDRINRKVPRVGQYIDPWWQAQLEFLKIGGVIEDYVGDSLYYVWFGGEESIDGRFKYFMYDTDDGKTETYMR